MIFNSPTFLIFLALTFLIYWRLSKKGQNVFLLFCSYVFYGWWDWRFLSLIFISSLADYIIGQKISSASQLRHKKHWLWLSIGINLSILGLFKYFNFFASSLQDALIFFGVPEVSLGTLYIILPVGISFYTFQTMSYTIEVYQGKIQPTRNIVEFFTFVSFFPQLVAGPIERASDLLVQFRCARTFVLSDAYDGMRQMLWGLFKKIVIADNLAEIVQYVYGNAAIASGPQLFAATFFFAFQIYCDFSGYSDIAIGTAKLFGIRLSQNFRYPYFARSIPEFWRRWHITLSSWFRDYVFIPLGGSRVQSKWLYFRNIFITFVVSGLWHGANWTFVAWGAMHGLCFIPTILSARRQEKKAATHEEAQWHDAHNIILTFLLVLVGWVFFRSQSLTESLHILQTIFQNISFANAAIFFSPVFVKKTAIVAGLLVVEWRQRRQPHPLHLENIPRWGRWLAYYILLAIILFFGNFSYHPFIYFQF
ncbi:acyltransferase [Candidatus Falkowbacteria bacterium RIFOXYC2_FULL_47_12]|uniref:Acyltransferase n=2 Tax=Candidatus Falkowiibacteriota TaxID=1752728 RepID=A0A1F5TNQ5_9BACT|nr:MAG: acyltransferase [Candidatus Falkowbacteria bacterium RIFOXYA2_FULL_47_9]OGF40625.1 MAG: acyltransferase [Candidatus Falkowbacteria bacterium RIFOXYC2_FULL_47_12]